MQKKEDRTNDDARQILRDVQRRGEKGEVATKDEPKDVGMTGARPESEKRLTKPTNEKFKK